MHHVLHLLCFRLSRIITGEKGRGDCCLRAVARIYISYNLDRQSVNHLGRDRIVHRVLHHTLRFWLSVMTREKGTGNSVINVCGQVRACMTYRCCDYLGGDRAPQPRIILCSPSMNCFSGWVVCEVKRRRRRGDRYKNFDQVPTRFIYTSLQGRETGQKRRGA